MHYIPDARPEIKTKAGLPTCDAAHVLGHCEGS